MREEVIPKQTVSLQSSGEDSAYIVTGAFGLSRQEIPSIPSHSYWNGRKIEKYKERGGEGRYDKYLSNQLQLVNTSLFSPRLHF